MSERAENATTEERILFNKGCTPGEVRNLFIYLCDQQPPRTAANAFSIISYPSHGFHKGAPRCCDFHAPFLDSRIQP